MFVTVFLQILSLAFASLRVRVCLKLLVLIFKMESAPAEKNQFFVVQINCDDRVLKKWFGASMPEETPHTPTLSLSSCSFLPFSFCVCPFLHDPHS